MEWLIIISIGAVAYFYLKSMNSTHSPNKPILRKDLITDSDTIGLTEGKKILRDFLKEASVTKLIIRRMGISPNDLSKSDINEEISSIVQNFSDNFKESMDDIKEQIKDLKIEIKENNVKEDIKELERLNVKLNQKDCSNDLLWEMNECLGVDRKQNAVLSQNDYKDD